MTLSWVILFLYQLLRLVKKKGTPVLLTVQVYNFKKNESFLQSLLHQFLYLLLRPHSLLHWVRLKIGKYINRFLKFTIHTRSKISYICVPKNGCSSNDTKVTDITERLRRQWPLFSHWYASGSYSRSINSRRPLIDISPLF